MRRLILHLTVAFLAVTTRGITQSADASHTTTYAITVRGARIGFEAITVTRSEAGWVVTSRSHQDPPIGLDMPHCEIQYGPDWQPQHLTVEETISGQPLTLATTFLGVSASSELTENQQ